MTEKIGILGCGWLGFPLAQALVQKNYEVYGTTTSQDKLETLKNEGINPYLVSLSASKIEGEIQDFLSRIDTLVINVPPRLRGTSKESFFDKMQLLLEAIKSSSVSRIIFISSTAVYGDVYGEVTEETPTMPNTESGRQLVQVEKLFQTDDSIRTTVIRFGGLIGPDRNPATMLSGRTGLRNGHDPINLIHLEDCIHMIITILEKGYWGELFNGVYPHHPAKRDFYTEQAQKLGIPAPIYLKDSDKNPGKIVVSRNFLDKSHVFNTSIAL
ncbi:SDR family oxidoreductase [Flagellimonas algicola]|uniref:SDR family oxidoreductase n=1 Tax=Flagellimonas algicola TaxID=2583815 RepID=A0ABY2WIV4_9FLAO|nr:SDR family oxidoreductase [Allomuricauda algicola]TMU54760.1 SDR family oxidoreductase [Allomuricauda algicola]